MSTVDNTTGNFFKTVKSYILGEKIVLLIIVLLCFLTVDVVINQISDVLAPINRSAVGISLFVAIAIVYSIGQYGIMKFISKAGKSIQEKSFIIKRVHEIVKNEQACSDKHYLVNYC